VDIVTHSWPTYRIQEPSWAAIWIHISRKILITEHSPGQYTRNRSSSGALYRYRILEYTLKETRTYHLRTQGYITFFKNFKCILVYLGLTRDIFLVGLTAYVKKTGLETDHEYCETWLLLTFPNRAVDHNLQYMGQIGTLKVVQNKKCLLLENSCPLSC
jgi:hypothetical protein